MEPILIITHADAGNADSLAPALAVLEARASVEVAETSNPGELDGVLHRAGTRTIVVAGGDGTLHAVIAALYRRHELGQRTLGLIPLGTGNDFARATGVPLDPAEAAAAVVAGAPYPMDLLVDELGEIVVNSVHVGASADASRKGAVWKERLGHLKLGLLGYPIGVALAAVRPTYLRLRVEVDGECVADMDRHVLMVAVGNGTSVGGGAQLTPYAEPGDGVADVMVSFATGPLASAAYLLHLGLRSHPERKDVVYRRAREVSVSGEDFWLSADGEMSGPERRRTWHVEPAAYSLILPS